MSICYASFSVGKHRSTTLARGNRDRYAKAADLLDTIPKHEHAAARAAGEAYNVRFVGPGAEPTLFRGTEPVTSRWAGISAAEVRAAREKVAAARDAGGAEISRFHDKLHRIREAAREALR